MPRMPPQHSSMPASLGEQRGRRRGRRRCASCRSSGTARGTLRGCGCSGARRRRRAARPARASAARASTRPRGRSRAARASTASITRRSRRSSGPRTATTMQNCVAPAARVARAASRISSMSRKANTSTPVWKRTDCEQNAQSSGQAPDLALMRLSSSTSGPHHASRTWCASAISDGQLVERELRDGERLVAGEAAVLVEQGAFGGNEGRCGHCGIVPIGARARPLGAPLVLGATRGASSGGHLSNGGTAGVRRRRGGSGPGGPGRGPGARCGRDEHGRASRRATVSAAGCSTTTSATATSSSSAASGSGPRSCASTRWSPSSGSRRSRRTATARTSSTSRAA